MYFNFYKRTVLLYVEYSFKSLFPAVSKKKSVSIRYVVRFEIKNLRNENAVKES